MDIFFKINKGFSKLLLENIIDTVMEKVVVFLWSCLPCPVESCRFGDFSQIYDKYLPELKHCLLTSNNKHTDVDKMKFSLVYWSYNDDRKGCWRATKRVMKLGMATHFSRIQQLDEFSSLQRNIFHSSVIIKLIYIMWINYRFHGNIILRRKLKF